MSHSTRSQFGVLISLVAMVTIICAERSERNQSPVFRSGADSVDVIAFAADRKCVPALDLRREALELATVSLAEASYRLQVVVSEGKRSEGAALIPFTIGSLQ